MEKLKIKGETIRRIKEIERLTKLELQLNPELTPVEARKIASEKYEVENP